MIPPIHQKSQDELFKCRMRLNQQRTEPEWVLRKILGLLHRFDGGGCNLWQDRKRFDYTSLGERGCEVVG
jgi:hypothetical protein